MLHEVSVEPWTLLTIVQIVFYPIFVLLKGTGNIFQNIIFMFSLLLLTGVMYELFLKKRYVSIGVIILLLALANIRVVPVGTLYYDAFHMIPWYGLCLGLVAVWIADIWEMKKIRNIAITMYGVLVLTLIYGFVSPASFMKEHSDTQLEFTMNYANYFSKGQVIKILEKPGDTMFVEMWEDPIYFVAGVKSAYSYSWYTSIMPFFAKYQLAREEMFRDASPTFYVGIDADGQMYRMTVGDEFNQELDDYQAGVKKASKIDSLAHYWGHY